MVFSKDNFTTLEKIRSDGPPCVSILLPTYRAGKAEEDKLRFKNALSMVKRNLQTDGLWAQQGMIGRQAEGFLTPAYDLLDDPGFWSHLSDGLAVFLDKDRFEHFEVPIDLDPLVYVKNHFYLRPLMPMLSTGDRFFLLALSQGGVRFFEGRRHHITPVKIEDLVPRDMEEALAFEDPEKSLQSRNSGGERHAIYHGHGLHKDQRTWQLEQFCRMVDNGLMEMLHDERAPLVLAAVDELVAVYRQVSRYGHIVDFHVGGNPEHDSPAVLHEKAWLKMKDYFSTSKEQKNARFESFLAEGRAACSLDDVVPAAVHGRVETLYLAKDAPVLWGAYHEKDNTVEVHEEQQLESVCLHNLAAVETYKQGGGVFILEREGLPREDFTMNALLRY